MLNAFYPVDTSKARSMVQALSDMRVKAEKLYILDSRGVLVPASELVYNDAPWLPDQQFSFVHPKLSNEVHLPDIVCQSIQMVMVCQQARMLFVQSRRSRACMTLCIEDSDMQKDMHALDVVADIPACCLLTY